MTDIPQTYAITKARVWQAGQFLTGSALVIAGDKIARVLPEANLPLNFTTIELPNLTLAPGFIDLLNHGAGGCSPETAPLGVARQLPTFGVTWFWPSLLSNPWPDFVSAARQLVKYVGPVSHGATIGGIHAEGPFFNPEFGGQKPENTCAPTTGKVQELLEAIGPGALRRITLAPELPGAMAAIEIFVENGVQVALGHTSTNAEKMEAAISCGATHITHIMNAAGNSDSVGPYQGVKPTGYEERALVDDRLTADMICDSVGAHVSAQWQRIVLRCKGVERLALVSDAMPPAGLGPGSHTAPDGQAIEILPGEDVAWLPDMRLYGYVAGLDSALRNFIRHTGLPLGAALHCVTTTPARLAGIDHHYGALNPGYAADFVVLDENVNVLATFIGGRLVYQSNSFNLASYGATAHAR